MLHNHNVLSSLHQTKALAATIITQKRASLRGCIDANCKDCIYDPSESGSWRKQVQNCTVTGCSLFPVRPQTIGGAN
jgi:hypothetical protein